MESPNPQDCEDSNSIHSDSDSEGPPPLDSHQIVDEDSIMESPSYADSSIENPPQFGSDPLEDEDSITEPPLDGHDDDSTIDSTNSTSQDGPPTPPSQDGFTPTHPTPQVIEFVNTDPNDIESQRATNNRFTFVPRGALPTVRQDPTRLFSRQKTDDGYYLMYTDSGADTSSIGGPAWQYWSIIW